MDIDELKVLIDEGLSIRSIAKRTNKGYSTIRYWLKKHKLITTNIKYCILCKTKLTGCKVKFCSNACKQKEHYSRAKKGNTYWHQTKRGITRKLKLMNAMGGSCEVCGYNKNIAALHFHHKDPTQKSFPLDLRRLSNNRWEIIELESKKCSLLCSRCHSEHHHPEMELELLKSKFCTEGGT